MPVTPEEVCALKGLQPGTPEYQRGLEEMKRLKPEELEKVAADLKQQQQVPPQQQQQPAYPYQSPFPATTSGRGSFLTQRGQAAPVPLSEGSVYPFPLPDKLSGKELSALKMSELCETCSFADACPVLEGASFLEAKEQMGKCTFAPRYGCPILFAETKPMKFDELKGVDIFNSGVHKGILFSKDDITEIAKNFEKFGAVVQPPMVLGHEEDNAQELLKNTGLPAAGWVKGVRCEDRDGKRFLVADFGDVPEIIAKLVEKKAYKRISAEIYADFEHDDARHGKMIRRVALLGGAIPEVKDLKDVEALHAAEAPVVFAFSDEGGEPSKEGGEEDMAKIVELEKKNTELQKQFEAEKKKTASLTEAVTKMQKTKDQETVALFCEARKKEGKILPKWEEMGLQRFIASLDDDKVLKFAEDVEDKKAPEISQREFFKRLLNEMPDVVDFQEHAPGAGDDDDDEMKRKKKKKKDSGKVNLKLTEKVDERIKELEKAGTAYDYAEVAKEVARENPDLVQMAETDTDHYDE